MKVADVALRHVGGRGLAALHDAYLHFFEHYYKVDWTSFVYSDEPFVSPVVSLQALSDCALHGSGFLVSDGDWVNLDGVLLSAPAPPAEAEHSKEEPAKLIDPIPDAPLWVSYPWLLGEGHQFGYEPPMQERKAEPEKHERTAAKEAAYADAFEELTANDLFAELGALRENWGRDENRSLASFTVPLRGGRWTAMNRGVVADSWRGEAANASAVQFCMAHNLPRSGTFWPTWELLATS